VQCECLCEATLELLVDEADDLLAQEADLRDATGAAGSAYPGLGAHGSSSEEEAEGGEGEGEHGAAGAGGGRLARQLRRHAAARVRGACRALGAAEQDLFLAFAAVLRVARCAGGGANADEAAAAAEVGAAHTVIRIGADDGTAPAALAVPAGGGFALSPGPGAGVRVPKGRDAVVRALCDRFASWLVHPLGPVCAAAREAAGAFLWFLVCEDTGYR
jgi:hypothetical protein